MATKAELFAVFLIGLFTVLAATPLAIYLAKWSSFYDLPQGYKAHIKPTPYLGGAAVLLAFALALCTIPDHAGRFVPVVIGALGLWAIGTVDDRRTVRPSFRLAATASAAALLWATGLGSSVFEFHVADLLVTVIWVTALVNAFNLLDNIDGVASAVAFCSALGVAALALLHHDLPLATLTIALAGACFGFLKFNLASPARIFLGDGGSMPIGFILAAGILALPSVGADDPRILIPAALLVAIPLFDTTLVLVSRRRRRVRIWSGGRDHLAHRLLPYVGSARMVTILLACAQSALCAVAVAATELGPRASMFLGSAAAALGLIALRVLETQTGLEREMSFQRVTAAPSAAGKGSFTAHRR